MENLEVLANFLTKNYTLKDLEIIESDIKALFDGFTFYYLVDAYDIVGYSLPFIRDDFFETRKINKYKDKAIAYESVLGEDSKSDYSIFFLPNEYKLELFNIHNKISGSIKEKKIDFENAINNILYKELRSSNEKNNNYIIEKFDYFIYMLILSDQKNDALSRFNNVIKNKVKMFSFECSDKKIEEYINEVFISSEVSDFSYKLYEEYINNLDEGFDDIDEEGNIKEKLTYRLIENLMRDTVVIDRIIQVNKRIVNDDMHKIIFLYLSSPKKTEKLMRYATRLDSNIPKVGKYNINRNIFHNFLFKAISEAVDLTRNKKEDIDKVMSLFKDIIRKKKIPIDLGEHPLSEALRKLINTINNSIGNSLIIDSYNNIINSIKKHKDNKDLEETEIKKLLHDANLLKQSIESIDMLGLPLFATTLDKYRQIQALIESYSDNEDFRLGLGDDVIKFIFQLFPSLLFINFDFDIRQNLKVNLFKLFDNITKTKTIDRKDRDVITQNIADIILEITNQYDIVNNSISVEIFLVLTVLELIVSSSSINSKNETITTKYSKEKEILNTLYSKKILLSTKIDKINKFEIPIFKNSKFYIQEIDYLILWIKRRIHDYSCIEEAKRSIEKYPKDPRFYHGLALAYISNVYDNIKSNEEVSKEEHILQLKIALNYLKEVNIIYNEMMHDQKIEIVYRNSIIKNRIAVINSINDISLRLLFKDNNPSAHVILEIRANINFLKKDLFNKIPEKYETYTTLLHTEAELEYQEALDYERKGNLEKAKDKIKEAVLIINKFLKLQKGHLDVNHKIFIDLVNNDISKSYKKLIGKKAPFDEGI